VHFVDARINNRHNCRYETYDASRPPHGQEGLKRNLELFNVWYIDPEDVPEFENYITQYLETSGFEAKYIVVLTPLRELHDPPLWYRLCKEEAIDEETLEEDVTITDELNTCPWIRSVVSSSYNEFLNEYLSDEIEQREYHSSRPSQFWDCPTDPNIYYGVEFEFSDHECGNASRLIPKLRKLKDFAKNFT